MNYLIAAGLTLNALLPLGLPYGRYRYVVAGIELALALAWWKKALQTRSQP